MQKFESQIVTKPDFSYLKIKIPSNETLKVEASSMAAMDSNIRMKTRLKGGLGRFFSSESLFINEFTAQNREGEIHVAPGPAGDIEEIEMDGQKKIFLTATSFLASTMGIDTATKWQGVTKGFFSGESFFIMQCSGVGQLWFNCYGALLSIDVTEEYVVDTGHIVAFSEGLDYSIGRFGGYKSLFFSGEGFVARFKGQGRLWIQTKRPQGLVAWADRFRRVQKSQ